MMFATSKGQKWNRVQKIDGDRCESVLGMALTPEEDIMLAGIYEDAGGVRFESSNFSHIKFHPNQDTFPYSHSTLFLARYSPAGQLIWVVNAFAQNGITPWKLHCDKAGNSIVCGNFRSLAIFHSTDGQVKSITGTPPQNQSTSAPLNYFVAKYDPKGILLWVKVARSNDTSVGFEVSSDDLYNVYVRTYCTYGTISFDTHTLFPRSDSGRYIGNYGLIVVKYSPEGDELWITRGGNIHITQMNVDGSGHIQLQGNYSSNAAVFTTSGKVYLLESSPPEHFNRSVIHLNSDGELVRVEPGLPVPPETHIHKTVYDRAGNCFALMQIYNGQGPGSVITFLNRKYTIRQNDILLARFDKNNKPVWFTQFEGENDDKPLDIVLDKNGNVIVSGHYRRRIAINDITGDSIVLTSDFQTLFLAAYTQDGLIKWACNSGNLFQGFGEQLHLLVNKNNQLFVGGQVNVPSELGKFSIDVKGEKGWNSPGWDRKIDYNKYSDAFWASLDLNEDVHYDVFVNVSLNLKEALIALAENLKTSQIATRKIYPDAKFIETKYFTAPVGITTDTIPAVNETTAFVYPNPAGFGNYDLTARITLASPKTITWKIINQSGGLMLTHKENYPAGNATFLFSVSGFSPGLYFLNIEMDTQRIRKKIVVI